MKDFNPQVKNNGLIVEMEGNSLRQYRDAQWSRNTPADGTSYMDGSELNKIEIFSTRRSFGLKMTKQKTTERTRGADDRQWPILMNLPWILISESYIMSSKWTTSNVSQIPHGRSSRWYFREYIVTEFLTLTSEAFSYTKKLPCRDFSKHLVMIPELPYLYCAQV